MPDYGNEKKGWEKMNKTYIGEDGFRYYVKTELFSAKSVIGYHWAALCDVLSGVAIPVGQIHRLK